MMIALAWIVEVATILIIAPFQPMGLILGIVLSLA